MHHSGSEPSLLLDYLDWPVQSPSLLRGNNTETQVAAPVQLTPVQSTRDEHAGNYPGDTLPRFSAPATVPTMSEGTPLFIRNEHAENYPRDIVPRLVAPATVPAMSDGTSLFTRSKHAGVLFLQNISLLFLQDLLVEAEVIQPLLLGL